MNDDLRLLRLSVVAKLRDISRSTAYELAAKGEIPTVRLSTGNGRGLVRVPSAALHKLIEERTGNSSSLRRDEY